LSAYLFPLYAFCHLVIFVWALYLARAHKAPGAWLVAMIAAGLVYDNLIISLGTTIGIGSSLQALSWPRFAMHALLTPFMMIAVTQMAAAGGIRWAQTTQWKVCVWVLVISMVIFGAVEHLIGLETVPACFDGILRYTTNLYPSHFCGEGWEVVKGSGPPIPSIIGNIITLVIGFFLWRHHGWIWLMAGALLMFFAAAVPFRDFGMAPGNGGEVFLMFAYVATVMRFGRFKKTSIEGA
jgi:hypothetical protein